MTRTAFARGRPEPRRRRELPDLSPLEALIPILGSRHVLVLGSAPLYTGHLPIAPGMAVVTVNGSVSTLPASRCPDVHLINARVGPHVAWNRERRALNAAMFMQAAHRHLGTLVLLPVQDVGAELATLERLDAQGSTWDQAITITKAGKTNLAHSVGVLHRDRDRHLSLSAGMLAVALALWCGAASVRTEGLSFDAGYAYLPADAVPPNARGHLRGDKTAIGTIRAKFGARVSGDLFTRRTQQAIPR